MSNVIWKISDITTTHLVKWPRLTAENTACGRKILTYNQQTRAKIIPITIMLHCWIIILRAGSVRQSVLAQTLNIPHYKICWCSLLRLHFSLWFDVRSELKIWSPSDLWPPRAFWCLIYQRTVNARSVVWGVLYPSVPTNYLRSFLKFKL